MGRVDDTTCNPQNARQIVKMMKLKELDDRTDVDEIPSTVRVIDNITGVLDFIEMDLAIEALDSATVRAVHINLCC